MARSLLVLVEDSPEITFIVRRYAKPLDHDLATFADAASAWEFLDGMRNAECGMRNEEPPPTPTPPSALDVPHSALPVLVLLDVNLPGGQTGLDLCRWLRATPHLAGLPVALFGSWERPEDILAGLRAGIDFLVSKDLLIHPDLWSERLREILAPADSRREALSLSWPETLTPEQVLAALNAALRRPTLQQMVGPDVLPGLLERALRSAARTAGLPGDALRDALSPGSLTIDPAWARRPDARPAVAALPRALLEAVWCLLGTAASAPFRDVLRASLSP
jgi:CheY-like chemotaxis protein